MPLRPAGVRMEARSRFSRRFISVKNVLRTRAFKSSVRCRPLVATRARDSPLVVMNFMISRCLSCGAFPSAVSRLISAQLASSERVKCRIQPFCSAKAAGTSCLHPEMWQVALMVPKRVVFDRQHSWRRKSIGHLGPEAYEIAAPFWDNLPLGPVVSLWRAIVQAQPKRILLASPQNLLKKFDIILRATV